MKKKLFTLLLILIFGSKILAAEVITFHSGGESAQESDLLELAIQNCDIDDPVKLELEEEFKVSGPFSTEVEGVAGPNIAAFIVQLQDHTSGKRTISVRIIDVNEVAVPKEISTLNEVEGSSIGTALIVCTNSTEYRINSKRTLVQGERFIEKLHPFWIPGKSQTLKLYTVKKDTKSE